MRVPPPSFLTGARSDAGSRTWWTAAGSLVLDLVQYLVELLGRPCREQLVHLVGVREDDGDLVEDLQVPVVHAGDADREAHLVAVPVDRLVIPDDGQPRTGDGVLRLVRAVRDGQVVPHVGGDRLLPLEHRVHVLRAHRAGVDQELPGLPDRLVLARRRTWNLDLGQGKDVAHRKLPG